MLVGRAAGLGNGAMRVLRPLEIKAKQLAWIATEPLSDYFDPAAAEFYDRLVSGGYEPDLLINVLPAHKLLYVAIPKAASTRIRRTLAQADGRYVRSLKPSRWFRFSGPAGPRSMTISSFHRLATGAGTLRFSFVRNPYTRAVSCWADKFRGKPLVPGDPFVDIYLARRQVIDGTLPAGADRTLSFADFIVFLAAVARQRCDIHFQVQDDILCMPGITLDLIGKVETFAQDFAPVLGHLRASPAVRGEAAAAVNESDHGPWTSYYTPDLAARLYRAYECDFDRFAYPRPLEPAS